MQTGATQAFARTDSADSPFRAQAFARPDYPSAATRATAAPTVAHGALDAMIARHAQANGIPESLVHRVVLRESRYNPRASNRGALGLMQIKYATARSMGYAGSAGGLFDAETNLTYAVRYLAGAYRAAGGNANRAVAYYAGGYYGRGTRVARTEPQASPVAPSGYSNASWQAGDMSPAWRGSPMQERPVALRDTDIVVYDNAPARRMRAARRI